MGSTKIKTKNNEEVILDQTADSNTEENGEVKATKKKIQRVRSKKYVNLRSQVDKTKTYDLDTAITLVKKLSRKNHPTLTADINTRETGISKEISLPHSIGKETKVAIADEKVLEQIEAGKIDFDILLAKPDMMAKLAKHARVLGPRGLMPNPKNNTVTPDPEKRKKELESNSIIQIKTEKKAPVMHVQVGSINQPEDEVKANLMALAKEIGLNKITKIVLSSTMSPGVKIELADLKPAS